MFIYLWIIIAFGLDNYQKNTDIIIGFYGPFSTAPQSAGFSFFIGEFLCWQIFYLSAVHYTFRYRQFPERTACHTSKVGCPLYRFRRGNGRYVWAWASEEKIQGK